MRKLISVFAMAVAMCATIVSCGMSKENTPEGVAKYAIYCMSEQKLEELIDCCDYTGEQRERSLEALKEMKESGMMGDIRIDCEVLNTEQITDDAAMVTVRMTYSNGEEPDEKDIYLHKIDGEWKVTDGLFN